jgi:hypothetical protein
MEGVGAGEHGNFGVSHIAKEAVDLCRVSLQKKRHQALQRAHVT